MSAANDNTIGGGPAANDNGPRIESVPDIDELAFEHARRNYDTMMNAIERTMIGKWFGMPPEKAPPRYCYTRAGLRGRPGTLEREATLRAYGFQPAPKGTQYGGFLTDGEQGSYWYAPVDLYQRMKDVQNRTRAESYARNMRAALAKPAQAFYANEDGEALARNGVEIGIAGVETGSATFDEVMEAERAAKARMARNAKR